MLGIRTGDAMGHQEARGKVKQLRGRVKETIGSITGNRKMQREGSRERAGGAVQEGLGKARRKVGKFVDRVAKAIKK